MDLYPSCCSLGGNPSLSCILIKNKIFFLVIHTLGIFLQTFVYVRKKKVRENNLKEWAKEREEA